MLNSSFTSAKRLQFFAAQLESFFSTREKNRDLVTPFVVDLSKALQVDGSNHHKKIRAYHLPAYISRLTKAALQLSIVSRLLKVKNFIDVIRDCDIDCYGVDQSRLWLPEGKLSRSDIDKHLSPSINRLLNNTYEKNKSRITVFLDPSFQSKAGVSNESKLEYLIDGFDLFLVGAFTFKYRLFTSIYQSIKARRRYALGLFERVLITLATMGSLYISEKSNRTYLVCLTSNSLYLEIFRLVIVSRKENQVLEVLHGIPTPSFDSYFNGILKALEGIDGGKFLISSSLPSPFDFPFLSKDISERSWAPASNSAINADLHRIAQEFNEIRKTNFDLSLNDAVASKIVESVTNKSSTESSLLVAFFGGTNIDGDFWSSTEFACELAVLKLIDRQAGLLKRNVTIIYSKHPKNDPMKVEVILKNCKFIEVESARLLYFIADGGVSLYSTALFDAAALGVKVLSLVPHRYELFHPEIASRVRTPADLTQDLISVEIAGLLAIKTDSSVSRIDLARGRLREFSDW
jgi:hypothetical protein